jgi:hypothetical protein
MNLPLLLNLPNFHTKRIVGVDIEHTQAKTRLAQKLVLSSSYAEVRCIRCEIRDGILYVRGQFTSFYLKQLTQETVRWMKGIDAISNCVEVVYPDRPVQTVADVLMPERSNLQLPNVLMDVTECQLNSAGSQLTIGQR